MIGSDVFIAIPCFRCAKQIRRVLKTILTTGTNANIVVFDNASDDETCAGACEVAAESRGQIRVMRNQENYGLGGTFQLAFEMARAEGAKYFIFFHGDDQADFRDVARLEATARNDENLSAVLGARFMPGSQLHGYSLSRQLGNRILNFVFSIVTRHRISDLGSGLTLYRVDCISREMIKQLPDHVAFDARLLLMMIRKNLPFYFIPISWREEDQVSTVKNISVGILLLKELFSRKSSTYGQCEASCRKSSEVLPED